MSYSMSIRYYISYKTFSPLIEHEHFMLYSMYIPSNIWYKTTFIDHGDYMSYSMYIRSYTSYKTFSPLIEHEHFMFNV